MWSSAVCYYHHSEETGFVGAAGGTGTDSAAGPVGSSLSSHRTESPSTGQMGTKEVAVCRNPSAALTDNLPGQRGRAEEEQDYQ